MSAGEQVLVCPTCQQDADWRHGLDRCPACSGIRLSKTLGALRCSGCGWVGESGPVAPTLSATDEQLAADVRAALARVLNSDVDG